MYICYLKAGSDLVQTKLEETTIAYLIRNAKKVETSTQIADCELILDGEWYVPSLENLKDKKQVKFDKEKDTMPKATVGSKKVMR